MAVAIIHKKVLIWFVQVPPKNFKYRVSQQSGLRDNPTSRILRKDLVHNLDLIIERKF